MFENWNTTPKIITKTKPIGLLDDFAFLHTAKEKNVKQMCLWILIYRYSQTEFYISEFMYNYILRKIPDETEESLFEFVKNETYPDRIDLILDDVRRTYRCVLEQDRF